MRYLKVGYFQMVVLDLMLESAKSFRLYHLYTRFFGKLRNFGYKGMKLEARYYSNDSNADMYNYLDFV